MDSMTPPADHPIRRLDPVTLDYVIESLVGIWAGEPDLLIESAIANVREIRKYAALPSEPPSDPERLDAAWAAAEAALPEGWWIEKVYLRERGTALETFSAWARRPDSDGGLRGDGDTPTAALRALSTTLADTPSVRGRVASRRLDQRLKHNRAARLNDTAPEPTA